MGAAAGWALARQLEGASEAVAMRKCCGETPTRTPTRRRLVDLAERLVPFSAERASAPGSLRDYSALERRVRMILSGSPASSPLTLRLRAAVALGTLAAVGAGLLLVSAAAAPSDRPATDPLADDARLAQQVRVTVEGLPVSDLLAQLRRRRASRSPRSRKSATTR